MSTGPEALRLSKITVLKLRAGESLLNTLVHQQPAFSWDSSPVTCQGTRIDIKIENTASHGLMVSVANRCPLVGYGDMQGDILSMRLVFKNRSCFKASLGVVREVLITL